MKSEHKYVFTRVQLAEERTILAFIRTVAIFAGIYVLMRKNIKNKFIPKFVLTVINLVLLYRLFHLKFTAHKYYIQIFGLCLIGCLSLIAYSDKL